jgi:hypothetical protein
MAATARSAATVTAFASRVTDAPCFAAGMRRKQKVLSNYAGVFEL